MVRSRAVVSAIRWRMSQAQVPHWGLVPQARNMSDGRRAPARTAASTSRSRMARQMQTYMDVSTPQPVQMRLTRRRKIRPGAGPVKQALKP